MNINSEQCLGRYVLGAYLKIVHTLLPIRNEIRYSLGQWYKTANKPLQTKQLAASYLLPFSQQMTSKYRESDGKWNNYSPYGTADNICLFICGQVEVLSVIQGCFY